jgi:ferredoxin/flavodoxin---NADP+ reductase
MAEAKFTNETITHWQRWTPKLFSFRLTRPAAFRFRAGQYARLGVPQADGRRTVWRPYSMVSAPYDESLEFFSIEVPEGEFTPQLAQLGVGDGLLLDKNAFGFLTLDRFPNGRDLWLLATGTGAAPFFSMLTNPETWERFENVVLAYGVRTVAELAYRDWLAALPEHPLVGRQAHRLRFIPAVTREAMPGALHCRLTDALRDGHLEAAADLPLSLEHSRLMFCGNPGMVEDSRKILGERGFKLSRQAAPGQLAFENYW